MTDAALFEQFLQLSSVLTGHSLFTLQGTGQAKMYYTTLSSVIGQEYTETLLSRFASLTDQAQGEEAQLHDLLRKHLLSDPKLGPLARNLIKMWYVGSWYELPEAWRTAYGVNENDRTFVVSSGAYIEGLLWPTIGAHPAGAKAPGYGSWNAPPDIPTD